MAKKRANGEGSIRRKPNGRWEGRYTQRIDPNTGRAIQKSVSAKTRAECKEELDRAIRGIPVNYNEDYTVTEWCRLWLETYVKPVIRPNTAKTYENIIENHIVPARARYRPFGCCLYECVEILKIVLLFFIVLSNICIAC